jgi:nicotinamidase-related amidase
MGFGTRPALFIIDVHYNFVGDEPEPILESVKKYRTSCGEIGWRAVPNIQKLLKLVRSKNFPVVYTISERRKDYFDSGVQRHKSYRHMEPTHIIGHKGSEIVKELAPEEKDILISKRKPSAFFGTPLMSFMNDLDVDTVILTGSTTSGCIRATAVDAFSYNFKTIIPEECCFDRFQSSHAMNLFDLNTKYADVLPLSEVMDHLGKLPAREDKND